MRNLYFSASNQVIEQITDLYDFVWPTASAMWNFRSQVKGFVDEVGQDKITQLNLQNRFDLGSGIHGANIKRAVLVKSWEEQQKQFAKILLINLTSIYEGWIDEIKAVLMFSRKVSDNLQFPSNPTDTDYPGVSWAIRQSTSTKSSIIQNAFYSTLAMHEKNALAKLENLLICYRFFKECRNCLIHRGGRVDQKAVDRYLAFSAIAAPINLDVEEVPEHFPLVVNEPIELSLRGIVGFGGIIIKLVATLDAELSLARNAEKELLSRLTVWAANNKKRGREKNNLNKNLVQRHEKVVKILRSLEFPEPIATDEIITLLLHEGIFKENYA